VIDLLPTFFAATEAASEHAAEEAEGIAALGLDPLAILAQALTFIVLFYIVKKFALEGIVRTLEERRKTIDSGVSLGYKMQTEQEKLEQRIEEELQKARQNADHILTDANKEAGSIIKAAEERASDKVDGMITDAHARIEENVKRAKKDLEREVATLVAEATEIVLGEKIDRKKDEELIKRALAGVK